MKKTMIVYYALAITISTSMLACSNSSEPHKTVEKTSEVATPEQQINRGKYLVTIMGCNDCHTPTIMTPHGPQKDTSNLLAGHPSQLQLPTFDKEYTKSWALFSQSGTAMVGPWGVSYGANLTSDATGIGNWTEGQFFKAFREGKFKGLEGARNLLPPMPWQTYANTSDEDTRAIFAYLKSTKPVHNIVPQPAAP